MVLADKALETSGVKKKKSQKLRDKKGNKSRIARIDTEGLNADEQNEKKNTSEQCNGKSSEKLIILRVLFNLLCVLAEGIGAKPLLNS